MPSISGISPGMYNTDYHSSMTKESLIPANDKLTYEETQVYSEVKDILSQYGFEDKLCLNKGKLQETGRTIEVFGFIGSITEESGYFSLGATFLKRMATDPEFKKEMLDGLKEQCEQQNKCLNQPNVIPLKKNT